MDVARGGAWKLQRRPVAGDPGETAAGRLTLLVALDALLPADREAVLLVGWEVSHRCKRIVGQRDLASADVPRVADRVRAVLAIGGET